MEDTNKVSSEWKEVLLKDISLGKGEYGIGASAVEYSDELPTYLRITDINDDGTLNYTGFKSVDDKNSYKYKLKRNDVVFARTGNSTGKGYFYEEDDGEFIYAGFLIKFSLDESKINPNYIGLYIQSKEYKNWINSIVTGSTRKNINAKMYGEMPIKLPSRNVQDRVVEIGKSINNKIKINNQMNQTLEEMAQAIFKEWFVEFNFPITPNFGSSPLDKGEGGKILGYKDNGGEMEESELGEIPEGWRVGTLGDIFELPYGKALKKTERIPGEFPVIGSSGIVDYHEKAFVKGPGIVIGRKGTIGKVIFLEEDFFPIDTTFYVKSKLDVENDLYYFNYVLLNQNFKHISSDSAVPGLNRNQAYMNSIVLSPNEMIKKFVRMIKPIFDIIQKNKIESSALTKTRDTLLPKLMSGEVRV